ncbi:MAG TPA: hypothetical protein VF158_05580 [Longimicrobiales bacterium]
MSGELAGVIISVTFFATSAAVILLAPITKRIGRYLEALIEEKRAALRAGHDAAARQALEDVARRLALLEERVQFAERLLAPAEPGEAERR